MVNLFLIKLRKSFATGKLEKAFCKYLGLSIDSEVTVIALDQEHSLTKINNDANQKTDPLLSLTASKKERLYSKTGQTLSLRKIP